MKDEERLKRGWREASISGGSHLKRTVEMYEELGYEVHLEELSPEECGQCTECYREANETIYRIYVRAKDEQGDLPGSEG